MNLKTIWICWNDLIDSASADWWRQCHARHTRFDEGDDVVKGEVVVAMIFRSKQANSETRWKDIKYLCTFLNQLAGDIFYKVIITKLLSLLEIWCFKFHELFIRFVNIILIPQLVF